MTKHFCDCCEAEIKDLDEALMVDYHKTQPKFHSENPKKTAIFCKSCLPVVVKILRSDI